MSNPQCKICDKVFKNSQGLDYHMRHNVCQKFTCTYCGRRFKSSLGQKYHIENRICLPPEKIKVDVVVKCKYHSYTIPRDQIKLSDIMKSTGNFGQLLFEAENIILKFIELTLCNPNFDQYWSCYVGNRRDPYVIIYDGNSWKLKAQLLEFQEIGRWAIEKIHKYLQDNKAVVRDKAYWTKYFITKDQFDRKSHILYKELRQGLFCLFANQKRALLEKSRITGINIKP